MTTIGIGMIGAGWVARNRHLPAFEQISEAEVRVIWSRKLEHARDVAGDFDIPAVAQGWREVINSSEIDAVVVATPPVLHQPATLAALEAGKHVLCQARMARNTREARSMAAAARDAGQVTALYPPRPGLLGDRTMRHLLHEVDFVGDVTEVRVTGVGFAEPVEGYDWRTDPDVVGVNAMALGLWVEVLNRWVGPAVRVVAIAQSHRGQRTTRAGERTEALVPDSLTVGAELTCGATASYHFSNVAASGPGHSIEIYGTEGGLIYDLLDDTIQGARVGDEFAPIQIAAEERRFQDTDAEFVEAILEGGTVSPDFEEGLQYMEFCEAVAYSAATGAAAPVPLPEPAMDAWGRFLDEDGT